MSSSFHPLICPHAHDYCWAETSGGVHAGSGELNLCNKQGNYFASQTTQRRETYRGKVSSGDGEADSQWDGSFDVRSAAVTDAVDDEHENEGDKGFDENALPGWQFRRNGSHAQVADEIWRSCSLRREKNNRSD